VIDTALIIALLLLAIGALHSRSLQRAVILFIGFGLVTALVWARLEAPDVALAEAAIGAGLTGALLLAALRDTPVARRVDRLRAPPTLDLLVTLLVLGVAGLFAWVAWRLSGSALPKRLGGTVQETISQSGVGNPVTAVLLNFRAYDTLLELAVLLTALMGILNLGRQRRGYRRDNPVLERVGGWLVPLLILVAGYLLWVGAQAPGGAFQAGAVLAAAGVMVHLMGRDSAGLPTGLMLRVPTVTGVGVFVLVGIATLYVEGDFLAYRGATAGMLILLIEAFATLGIALTLVTAYLGGAPPGWYRHRRRNSGA
jgi:multisubunit Na+/H+ antiporter MnhB subunit